MDFRFQLCAIMTSRGFFREWKEFPASVNSVRKEIETLRVIECLKRSGLEIKDIKQFMDWCVEGVATYPQRKELFEKQKKTVELKLNI